MHRDTLEFQLSFLCVFLLFLFVPSLVFVIAAELWPMFPVPRGETMPHYLFPLTHLLSLFAAPRELRRHYKRYKCA